MFDKNNFTIVDVETTGANAYFGRVIEIGLLRVEKGEVVETYQTLLNPDQPLPEFITKITGIEDYELINQPRFEDIAEDLLAKFEDAIFVAHNAQFDYSFLKEEFRRVGLAFNLDRLCTVKLSRAVFKNYKRHNLTEIIERHGFICENRHRAFDDAKVLWDLMQLIQKETEPQALQKIYTQLLTKSRTKKKVNTTNELTYETDSGEIIEI